MSEAKERWLVARKRYKFTIYALSSAFMLLGILFVSSTFSKCKTEYFKYINPQIVCGSAQTVNKKNYVAFKSDLENYIGKAKQNGQLTDIGVYFRDLQYGPTFGINEYADFSPASLLKLPMMVTYLTLYEDNHDILDVSIYYEGKYESDLTQSIKPSVSAVENKKYKIRELIDMMIKNSDNNSYYVLLDYLNEISTNTQVLRDTFIDLGVIDPQTELDETITVKSYAGIFTQLFNSSYFSSKDTSELALDILSKTDFHDGIVAGVPKGVQVAHKFGERFDLVNNVFQLHDCGIVYFPKNPYLLCIMTKGRNMSDLKNIVSGISKMVYEEFESRRL